MSENYEESISLTLRFKETIRNARKNGTTNGSRYALQDMQEKPEWGDPWQDLSFQILNLRVILEASESTRLRMEESLPNYHEDHVAEKGDNSLQHCNLVHKFIPLPQAMKIPAAKSNSG